MVWWTYTPHVSEPGMGTTCFRVRGSRVKPGTYALLAAERDRCAGAADFASAPPPLCRLLHRLTDERSEWSRVPRGNADEAHR